MNSIQEQKPKKKKKPAKGEMREAIEVEKAKLRQEWEFK